MIARARPQKNWKKKFIKFLSRTPFVGPACAFAGVSRVTAYAHRNDSKEFAKQWDEAIEFAHEQLDKTHFNLTLKGFKRGVWKTRNGRPVKVETITEHDLKAMQWRLETHYEKYRNKSEVRHVGDTANPVVVQQLPPLVPKELEDGV